ncbi:MAG: FAD-dependent monooxygenase [Pseudomonadota bacterium]
MNIHDHPITIVGAGVAGLAVARALSLRGAEVDICERRGEIGEVGAGLQVSPNGLRVIDGLGLGEALRDVAVQAEAVILRDGASGRQVLRLDLSRTGGETYFVHRARLIEVLARGAFDANVEFEMGTPVEPGERAAFVIGADGWRSRFRAAINGEETPFFTGQVAWRALIPDAGSPPVADVFMGPGRHLVSYPLAGGLRNIVAVEERGVWAEAGWNHRDDPGAVRAAFAGFGGPVPDWLAALDDVYLWGLFRHEVADTWFDEKAAILGDAAHPTLPFLAQGANMALEDAWVMAALLGQMPRAEALALYQAARRPRVSRVIEAANANARNYHLSGLTKFAAHTGLRIAGRVAPDAALRRFDWLYGYDATTEFPMANS